MRALLAYLALAPHAVARSQLCELLWDVPDDPRGELRWCLSKLRRLVDEDGRRRIQTAAGTVTLDLSDCFVDALEVARSVQDIDALDVAQLRTLAALFAGDFLEGLEIDSPVFTGWLIAQRRRFRGCHAALLERLANSVAGDEALGYLEKWLEVAPFDRRVHELLLRALARAGQIRAGEEQLAATLRLFETEGLDATSIRDAWRLARSAGEDAIGLTATAFSVADAASGAVGGVARPLRASVAVMPFVD